MRTDELPTFIRTRHQVVIVTSNVIKAKINVKLCCNPYKAGYMWKRHVLFSLLSSTLKKYSPTFLQIWNLQVSGRDYLENPGLLFENIPQEV